MKPEKLSLWDRIFNKYRKEIIERGSDNFFKRYPHTYYNEAMQLAGKKIPTSDFSKDFVVYKITNRVTGSEEIKKEYLN